MSWKRLAPSDLELVLSEDELDKLRTLSLAQDRLSSIIQDQLDSVSDAFRGAWRSKGYDVDVREHYTASEYRQFILDFARWEIWTRFPMTEEYCLSKPREKLYDQAAKLLEDPYIGISKPDYSDDPGLSSAALSSSRDAAISVPWLKFPPQPFDTGFVGAYPFRAGGIL